MPSLRRVRARHRRSAKAGTIPEGVAIAVLDLDRREDKASLMPKLKELAETVQGNAKLGENSRKAATDALDYWKSGT